MIRVITGTAKGKALKVPTSTRPLTDRIKTSLFDTIIDVIDDADVLDLFAGSGNFGIEALSRGAKSCLFIELAEKAIDIIKENLSVTKLTDKSTVINKNVNSFLNANENKQKFDLIFCDPPFRKIYKIPLDKIEKFLKKDGVAIIRYPKNFDPKDRVGKLKEILTKDYGENIISFYKI